MKEYTFRKAKRMREAKNAISEEKIPVYEIRWDRLYSFCDRKNIRKVYKLAGLNHKTIDKLVKHMDVSIDTLNKIVKYINYPKIPFFPFKYEKIGDKLRLTDIVIPVNLSAKARIYGIESINDFDLNIRKMR